MKKILRKISVFIAAAMCVTILAAVPVSAAEKTKTLRKECEKLAGVSYSTTYVKWMQKYHEKDTKNTLKFKNSMIKKHIKEFGKANSKFGTDKSDIKLAFAEKDSIYALASKGSDIKVIIYDGGQFGAAYIVGDDALVVDPKNKTYNKIPVDDTTKERSMNSFSMGFDSFEEIYGIYGFEDSAKGKKFTVKSGEKTYIYEEFTSENGNTLGMLFTESGEVRGMYADGECICLRFSSKVKSSEFELPKDYTLE